MTIDKQRVGLRGRELHGKLLSFALGEEDELLRARAAKSADGRASKTLVKEGPLRITLVALRKGGTLSSHQVAGPISMQMLRGALNLTTGAGDVRLETGHLVTLEAKEVHATTALTDCALLLTITMP